VSVLSLVVLVLFFLHQLFADLPLFILLQVLAAALMVWARLTFGARSFHIAANPSAGRLVTNGPYRLIRHPIYSALLLFVWAGVASHWSVFTAGLALLASASIVVRILTEESLLIAHYPEYRAYAERTKRLIPFVF
jgi:protein-S-isoprenylcysteine O-methyltransferase Ste14